MVMMVGHFTLKSNTAQPPVLPAPIGYYFEPRQFN